MSAPTRARIHLTLEIVERFARYHQQHPAWGVLHVSLGDGNWTTLATPLIEGFDAHLARQLAATGRQDRPPTTDEERELARLHDLMSPSQRRRLAGRCDEIERNMRTHGFTQVPTGLALVDGPGRGRRQPGGW